MRPPDVSIVVEAMWIDSRSAVTCVRQAVASVTNQVKCTAPHMSEQAPIIR